MKGVLESKLGNFKRHVFSELEKKMSEFFLMKISRKKKGRIQRCREVTRGRQKNKEGRGLGSQKRCKKRWCRTISWVRVTKKARKKRKRSEKRFGPALKKKRERRANNGLAGAPGYKEIN